VGAGRLGRKSRQVPFWCAHGDTLICWFCIFQKGNLPSNVGVLDDIAFDGYCCDEGDLSEYLSTGVELAKCEGLYLENKILAWFLHYFALANLHIVTTLSKFFLES
jgi:hypothetical protein